MSIADPETEDTSSNFSLLQLDVGINSDTSDTVDAANGERNNSAVDAVLTVLVSGKDVPEDNEVAITFPTSDSSNGKSDRDVPWVSVVALEPNFKVASTSLMSLKLDVGVKISVGIVNGAVYAAPGKPNDGAVVVVIILDPSNEFAVTVAVLEAHNGKSNADTILVVSVVGPNAEGGGTRLEMLKLDVGSDNSATLVTTAVATATTEPCDSEGVAVATVSDPDNETS